MHVTDFFLRQNTKPRIKLPKSNNDFEAEDLVILKEFVILLRVEDTTGLNSGRLVDDVYARSLLESE